MAIIFSAILMVADARYDHLRSLRSALSTLMYPVQWLADSPIALSDWLSSSFSSRLSLLAANARLNNDILKLQMKIQKLDELELENIRLRSLLGTSVKVGERGLIAELLEVDLQPHRHMVRVDKGSGSGVYAGQAVLDARAVIGQVLEVARFTSTILLITDAAHALQVRNQRSGVRTVAMGTGDIHTLSLPHLPNNADFEEGDLLVTTGLARNFPDGYPVARVTRVTTKPGAPFLEVEAEPVARLDRMREVLLVWSLDERRWADAERSDNATR